MGGIRLFAATIVMGAVVLSARPAVAAPTLTVSPGSGVYTASQGMDVVILFEGLNNLAIVGGQVLLDDRDVTGWVLTTFRAEALTTGFAFRSLHQPMGYYGLGPHSFRVTVLLSDGSQLQAGAVWQVLK